MDDSELLNLPDDEFDAFNDETFGGDGGEYTWESNQDLYGNAVGNGSEVSTKNSLKTGALQEETFEEEVTTRAYEEFESYERQSRETEFYEFENENALEESISRMVLDEFDDEEDAAANERLRRIAASKNSFAYLMPPQVVNRHLQWFMDKELPGGSSLLGPSVWSMHPTSITPAVAEAKASSSAINQNQYSKPVNTSEPSAGKDIGTGIGPAQAISAGSDLSNLLGVTKPQENITARLPPGLNNMPPKFKTVDEIEQEMLRDSERHPKPAEVKKQTVADSIKARPKVMSVEELERELIQDSKRVESPHSSVAVPSMPTGVRHMGPPVIGPADLSQHFDQIRPPFPIPGSGMKMPSNLAAQQPPPPTMPAPVSASGGYYNIRQGLPGRPGSAVQRPVVFPHNNNLPPNMMAQAGIAAQAAFHQLQLRQQQQQQMRFLQQQINPSAPMHPFRPMGFPMPPNQRNNLPFGFPLGPHRMNQQAAASLRRQDIKTEDRDVGLMTEKDKQRLKNIQIVQLQNDHPHTTDYYCLMRRVRVGGNGRPPLDLLRMLFPRKTVEDDSNRRQYEPAHFENSLGKLQAQSALAPKKAIDTVIRVVDSGPTAGKKKSYRYLLLEIEKIYECLLALEEADLRTALGTTGSGLDDGEVKLIKGKMERLLQDPKKLSEIMAVKKGKLLVCRLAALIDQPIRTIAVIHLFKSYRTWSSSGSTNSEVLGSPELAELFPYLRHCVLHMDSVSLEALCLELNEDVIESMVTTKLGMSLIMALLHRGEKLISGSQVTDQFKSHWNRLGVIPILRIILQHKADVVPPIEVYNLGLQRLLTSELHRLNGQTKEELSKLLTSFLNAGTKVIKQDY